MVSSSFDRSVFQEVGNSGAMRLAAGESDLMILEDLGLRSDDISLFYSICNGGYFGSGDDFLAENGNWYWSRVNSCIELTPASASEYVLAENAKRVEGFIQFLHYGDGDFIGVKTIQRHTLVVDFFHENAGAKGTGHCIASSLVDLFSRLLIKPEPYWLQGPYRSSEPIF